MHFSDVLKIVLKSFRTNKIRSFLTILGIVIGIGSVIVIVSLGAGAQELILNQIKSVGSNLVGILPGASDEEGIPANLFGLTITTLKYEDAIALDNKNAVPNVVATCAYVKGIDTISSKKTSITGDFMGVSASYVEVENSEIKSGRFFTPSEEKGLAKVAVLGSEKKKDLFGDEDPIGQKIKVKRESFEVIGVLAERGASLLSDQDNQVFVPILTAQKILLGINYLGFIRAKVDREENVPYAIENIKSTLRHRHNISNPADDDFSVRSTVQALDILGGVTDALRFFLVGIAALSLVVGGVGIMNIMLIAVTERTREIGLRKALGARRKDLLAQFLTEAATMSLVGGIVGVLGGIGFSALIAVGADLLGYEWSFIVSPASVIMACVVAITIGLVFGFYPAKRAADLDPIQALRYE